jgi:hypothetical protein
MSNEPTKTADIIAIGGKMYGVCADCGEIVRINKPMIGSTHFCTTEEERAASADEINAKWEANLRALRGIKTATVR